jgi:hypothetical protein
LRKTPRLPLCISTAIRFIDTQAVYDLGHTGYLAGN